MWIVLVSFPAHWQNIWENLPEGGQAYSAHAFRGFCPWALRTAWEPVMRGSSMGETSARTEWLAFGSLSWGWNEGWGQGHFPNRVPTSKPNCEWMNYLMRSVLLWCSRLWTLVCMLGSHPGSELWCAFLGHIRALNIGVHAPVTSWLWTLVQKIHLCTWAFDTLQIRTLAHIKGSSSPSVLVIIWIPKEELNNLTHFFN